MSNEIPHLMSKLPNGIMVDSALSYMISHSRYVFLKDSNRFTNQISKEGDGPVDGMLNEFRRDINEIHHRILEDTS